MMSSSKDKFLDIFSGLTTPEAAEDTGILVLRTSIIPQQQQVRVAKDSRGLPAVVVTPLDDGNRSSTTVELALFSYYSQATCRVFDEHSEAPHENLAVLMCRSDDPTIQHWFLRTLGALLVDEPSPITRSALNELVERLVRLFTALTQPPTDTIQGLWGELVLIAHASDPAILLQAWHSDPLEVHDFVDGVARLEVKTTVGHGREHHFSLDQLLCPEGVRLAIVSLLLQSSADGMSIVDLVGTIEERLEGGSGLVGKLHEVVSATVGRDWVRTADQRYSVAEGLAQLRVFDARMVPRVDPDLPPGVRNVRFVAELWDVPCLKSDLLSAVPLWHALPPQVTS